MSKNEGSKNKGSRNERAKLQKVAGQRKQQEKQRRKPDQRIRRTCERLGSALVALIQEKPIDDVTVQEFAHIGDQKKLYRTLADSGRLNDFFDLAQGYFARGIEQRLTESKRLSNLPQRELGARASALAGSVLSLLRWWLDHGAKESPRAMDELFHRMLWNGLQ